MHHNELNELPKSKIKVDGNEVEGRMTVMRSLDTESNPNKLVIEGIMQVNAYFEEINEIETDKLVVKDILVYREAFGTSEEDIVYNFVAGDLVVK